VNNERNGIANATNGSAQSRNAIAVSAKNMATLFIYYLFILSVGLRYHLSRKNGPIYCK